MGRKVGYVKERHCTVLKDEDNKRKKLYGPVQDDLIYIIILKDHKSELLV